MLQEVRCSGRSVEANIHTVFSNFNRDNYLSNLNEIYFYGFIIAHCKVSTLEHDMSQLML